MGEPQKSAPMACVIVMVCSLGAGVGQKRCFFQPTSGCSLDQRVLGAGTGLGDAMKPVLCAPSPPSGENPGNLRPFVCYVPVK